MSLGWIFYIAQSPCYNYMYIPAQQRDILDTSWVSICLSVCSSAHLNVQGVVSGA